MRLGGALSLNAIAMIGIGPLVTIPLVLAALHGPRSLAGWGLGALVALCDGLVWAELAAALPGSGGLYGFFMRVFAVRGRPLAFLYVWMFALTSPFLLASGYIGFAQYATYLWPALRGSDGAQHLVAVGVGVLTILLVARAIGVIERTAIALFGVAAATLLAVIIAAWSHPTVAHPLAPDASSPGTWGGLGAALLITLYDYLGYATVASVGEEVVAPARTIPRAIVLAIAIVGASYVALQLGVLGAIPWQSLVGGANGPPDEAKFVASTVVVQAWGGPAAMAVTVAILITAFASTFASLVAFARVPFAAARDGLFFSMFVHLHPRGRFPDVAVIALGALALPVCFLPLDAVLNVVGAGLLVFSGFGVLVAVVGLRRMDGPMPFRMPLYPLPAVVALVGWCYVFMSAGIPAIAFTVAALLAGVGVYAAIYSRSRTSASAGKDTS